MGTPQSNLPPGFRFHPTDEELILHYLGKRIASMPLPVSIIAEVDIYKFDPWDLPEKAAFGEKEWYFFSPRDRKYPNGARPNRAAASGYWKATGTDKTIVTSLPRGGGQETVGVKKALVFYKGRPPKGVKTNWIMHEYRLIDNHRPIKLRDSSMRLDDWVLCRIYKRSKYALPSTPEATMAAEHEDQLEEQQLYKDTISKSTKDCPVLHQNTLISQKSMSFSNLLDAMDYSMLSSFLSENQSNPQPGLIGPNCCNNLDQQSSPNHNSSNSFLFQKSPQLNNNNYSVLNLENNRPKRQLFDIDDADDTTSYPSKKFLSSCNMTHSNTGQFENPQWNLILKQSLLNQQVLLGPHLRFQG